MIQVLTTLIQKFKKFDPAISSARIYIQEYLCENGIREAFVVQYFDKIPKICGFLYSAKHQ